MNRIKLLIFDWDGTLADSADKIVNTMQGAIRALGLPARDDQSIRELIGLGLNECLQLLYPEIELARLLQLLDGYKARWVNDGAGEADLFAGALEAVQALHGDGFDIAVATGKSRKGLERSLTQHVGIRRLLINSRCADETLSKPDPLMLRELLADQGLAPHEALMIGDTDYDMAMAAAIEMPAVGVSCGVHAPERLQRAGAIGLLDGVAALPAWLAQSRAGEGRQIRAG
jgi:phosphoglycolate phosphatase